MAPHEDDDEYDYEEGVLSIVKNQLLRPVYALTSPTALKTYFFSILVFVTSLIFLASAPIAYIILYNAYVPHRGFTRPVHLQYPSSAPSLSSIPTTSETALQTTQLPFPYGFTPISLPSSANLSPSQRYDVTVHLDVPRSQHNVDLGNFMISLSLLQPDPSTTAATPDNFTVHATSTRPAILTYRSPLAETAYLLPRLPLYSLDLGHEHERLSVVLFEAYKVPRQRKDMPSLAKVELLAPLQVYQCEVEFQARLEGLRWFMWRHWIVSAVVFSAAFWTVEMVAAATAWGVLSVCFGGAGDDGHKEDGEAAKTIKREGDEVSSRIKKEEEDEEETRRLLEMLPEVEGDVEDEGEMVEDGETLDPLLEAMGDRVVRAEGRLDVDSGLGTSMESENASGSGVGVRRRKSMRDV